MKGEKGGVVRDRKMGGEWECIEHGENLANFMKSCIMCYVKQW